MPERIIFPEYRDELEPTRYPFGDMATLLATDGITAIERDTFLDATLYPILGQGSLYIAKIVVSADTVRLVIGAANSPEVAAGEYSLVEPPAIIALFDVWERPAGLLVSDAIRLARFGAWNRGTYTFTAAATPFAATCVVPTPEPGVRGLLTVANELFTGDIWLIGDNGVVLRAEDVLDGIEATIRVDIVGDPLFVRKLCDQVERFATAQFVQTINHCPPDAYGNYHLAVDDYLAPDTVVRIYPTADDTLRIEAVGQSVKE